MPSQSIIHMAIKEAKMELSEAGELTHNLVMGYVMQMLAGRGVALTGDVVDEIARTME